MTMGETASRAAPTAETAGETAWRSRAMTAALSGARGVARPLG
jgi:hypothetical protein